MCVGVYIVCLWYICSQLIPLVVVGQDEQRAFAGSLQSVEYEWLVLLHVSGERAACALQYQWPNISINTVLRFHSPFGYRVLEIGFGVRPSTPRNKLQKVSCIHINRAVRRSSRMKLISKSLHLEYVGVWNRIVAYPLEGKRWRGSMVCLCTIVSTLKCPEEAMLDVGYE